MSIVWYMPLCNHSANGGKRENLPSVFHAPCSTMASRFNINPIILHKWNAFYLSEMQFHLSEIQFHLSKIVFHLSRIKFYLNQMVFYLSQKN